GDLEQHERGDGGLRLVQHPEDEHEQREQADGGQRARGPPDPHPDPAPPACLTEPPGESYRDGGRDDVRGGRAGQERRDRERERQGAREPLGREDPRERVEEEVHPAPPTRSGIRSIGVRAVRRGAHGMSSRPASTSSRSITSAITITATTPANTSTRMRRCSPFVNRYPRLSTPIRMPTVASAMVDTAVT